MSTLQISKEKLIKTATRIANDATWVFGIVVAMSIISSLSTIRYLNSISDDLGDLYEKDIKGQSYAQNAYATLLEAEASAKDLALASSDDERKEAADTLRVKGGAMRSLLLKAIPTLEKGKYRTLTAKSKADAKLFVETIERGLGPDGSATPDVEGSRQLLAALASPSSALKNDLGKLNDVKKSSSFGSLKSVRTQLRVSLYINITILVISLGIRIFLWRGKKNGERGTSKNDCGDKDKAAKETS